MDKPTDIILKLYRLDSKTGKIKKGEFFALRCSNVVVQRLCDEIPARGGDWEIVSRGRVVTVRAESVDPPILSWYDE